ncbi:MAG: site-specific integrase [Clostridia bacterium]|nr:site-specific integrase [Clostridia bacterium]
MAKHRQRVMISTSDDGAPVYQWVQGNSLNELNDRIVQVYIQSGRIWEFMPNPFAQGAEKPSVLLKDYVHKWLTTYKQHKLKPTSLTTYEKWLNSHILPAFGERSIASITTADIQQFLNDRREMSGKSLTFMRNLMGEIFKDAVEDGLIEKDPTSSRRLIIPSDKVTERKALPLADFKDILSHLCELPDEERRLLALLMLTGMRRGEVLGLRWEDIDVENSLIHVRRNVTHPQTNQPYIGTPKTKSGTRDIPLDPLLVELLAPVKTSGFLIGGDQPVSLTHYTNTWNRIKKAVDLHGATAHVFRHSYLTYAAGESSDLKSIQSLAGHSDIRMTMNRYVHAQPEKLQAVASKMHTLLAG